MAKLASVIGEFSILPISIPPLPSYPHVVTHHVYARRNSPKAPTANDARSLFLTNLPVDSTEAHIRGIFVSLIGAGRLETVTFEDERKQSESTTDIQSAQAARLSARSKKRKRDSEELNTTKEEALAQLPETWSRTLRKSGGSAVVLLADEKSVAQSLKAIAKLHKTKKYPTWGEGVADRVPRLGVPWLRSHNRLSYPDREAIQDAVNTFFNVFDRKEQEAAELAKRLRNEPDEDGFVTVTRGGRTAPARKDEAEEARKKMVDKQEKKKTEMTNFYRFQLREKRKAEQADLLKRFEEDARKVSEMREKRGKFRPEE